MQLKLYQRPRCEPRQEQRMRVAGGLTRSIFPKIEKWLMDNEHLKALMYVAKRKKIDRYDSVIDFLFCETFPKFRNAGLEFNFGTGSGLKDLISEIEIEFYAQGLLNGLRIAYEVYCKKIYISWQMFCFYVKKTRVRNLH